MRSIGGEISNLGSLITNVPEFIRQTFNGAFGIAFSLFLVFLALAVTLSLFPALAAVYATVPTPIAMVVLPGIVASSIAIRDRQWSERRNIGNTAVEDQLIFDEPEVNYRALGAVAALFFSAPYIPTYTSVYGLAAGHAASRWGFLAATSLVASAGEQFGSRVREAIYPRNTAA